MNAQSARQTNWFLVWFAIFLLLLTSAAAFATFVGAPIPTAISGSLMASFYLLYRLRKNLREGKVPPANPYPQQWGFLKLRTWTQQRAFAGLMIFLGVGVVGDAARFLRGEPSLICIECYATAVATAWLVSGALFERQLKTV